MKDTLINLDMIWIDDNKRVVYIQENAVPCKTEVCEIYIPSARAKYVLEVSSGVVKKMEISVGDEVNFNL